MILYFSRGQKFRILKIKMEFEDFEDDNRELSHYGSSLANLNDLDMSPNLEKIRVLHCENLTSMNELSHLT